jgi:hypothetical protein
MQLLRPSAPGAAARAKELISHQDNDLLLMMSEM